MKNFLLLILLISAPGFSMSLADIQDSYKKSFQYEKIQDYEKAINSLSGLYSEYPKTYTINFRLGWLYYLKQNYANSIEHYKAAMKAAPNSIEAVTGYILPLMAQGKYSEVETTANQILRQDAYNYYGNLRLAFALRMNKKYDLSQKICYKMLELYPTDISFLVELGLSKVAKNEMNDAYSVFIDVLTLDPENVTAKYYLKK